MLNPTFFLHCNVRTQFGNSFVYPSYCLLVLFGKTPTLRRHQPLPSCCFLRASSLFVCLLFFPPHNVCPVHVLWGCSLPLTSRSLATVDRPSNRVPRVIIFSFPHSAKTFRFFFLQQLSFNIPLSPYGCFFTYCLQLRLGTPPRVHLASPLQLFPYFFFPPLYLSKKGLLLPKESQILAVLRLFGLGNGLTSSETLNSFGPGTEPFRGLVSFSIGIPSIVLLY